MRPVTPAFKLQRRRSHHKFGNQVREQYPEASQNIILLTTELYEA